MPDASVEPPPPPIPDTTVPCEHPEYWPHALQSARYPLTVHYRALAERSEAQRTLDLLETSWSVEVDQLGFRPPLPDGRRCGSDDRFDVFVWRGIDQCFVDVLADNLATPHDDQYAYMVVDPWGQYGGAILAATVAHELNHACQAADDWYDAPAIYEMTAVLMEEAVCDDDNGYRTAVAPDFQARPDWSIDRDDDYDTWFMYGGALYLMYLRDRHFAGSYAFAGQMWQLMRDGTYVDALDALLAPKGTRFVDTVAEFQRWRWYTGTRDDGRHLREAAMLPMVPVSRALSLSPAPMLLGSAYVEIEGSAPLMVGFTPGSSSAARRWVVQAVPGLDGSDGEVLALPARVALAPDGKRTLILTPVPTGAYDPDARTDTRYAGTLTVTP
jgi:hypothetical protein